MIVIDASPAVHHKAGLGRYAEDLIGALVQRSDPKRLGVFYHNAPRARPSPTIASLPAITSPLGSYPWRLRALLAQIANAGQDQVLAGLGPVDLFHATEHLLPRFKRAPTVFTLHDLIFRAYPRFHLPRNWIYLQLAIPLFLRRATGNLRVGLDAAGCRAAMDCRGQRRMWYEGVHARFGPVADPARRAAARAKYKLPERYLLALSTIEPRKNLLTLFDAIARLDNTKLGGWADVPLIVGGRQGWLTDETYAAVKARGLEGRVRFAGFIGDEDLPAVMSQAALFCFPSLYEGFGFPPLEAMACGAPVLSSDASSLPEVLGDAAEYAAPTDPAAWARAIERLLSNEEARHVLAVRGPAQARRASPGRGRRRRPKRSTRKPFQPGRAVAVRKNRNQVPAPAHAGGNSIQEYSPALRGRAPRPPRSPSPALLD
ncbi:MAG: glycosyltransferase family 4 protein [Anaerolineae bacterium]|nr:glycosyltransferase family 4 protein [Anaerolineae bacterium]